MPVPDPLPSFGQVPAVEGAPPQPAWWLFGRADRVGLFNLPAPAPIAEPGGVGSLPNAITLK